MAFQVNATALKGDTTTLTLAKLVLYDENTNTIPATRANGLFTVDAPETVSVTPNPFTPNNDGFNDFVNFRFPEMLMQPAEVVIFNISGKQVRRLSAPNGDGFRWHGVDDDGRALEPGVYIYLIKTNGKNIKNGTITLMR
jgi:gliding motility-associated-like protein